MGIRAQRARRGADRQLATHVRVPEAALAIQRVSDASARFTVDAAARRSTVNQRRKSPRGVITRQAIGQRISIPRGLGAEPVQEDTNVAGVLALRSVRERLALKPALELKLRLRDVAELLHPARDPILSLRRSPPSAASRARFVAVHGLRAATKKH